MGFGKPAALPAPSGTRRVYDAIVLGPDVGGAAAAALLARRGLRVLMAPLGLAASARESDGWLLPAAHPMIPPLRQLSGATGALDELGLGQDLQRQAAPTAGAFQLLGEKLRLSLPNEPTRRRSELKRELPDDEAAQTESGLDTLERLGRPWDPFLVTAPPLPARGFFERRRLRKMIPTPPELPQGLIGEALSAVAPFAASLVGDSAPEATARLASALLRAPLRLWGGAAQFAELLRKRAQEAGADLLTDSGARGLVLERKGVMLQLGGAEIRGSSLILACDEAALSALCEGGGRSERKLAEEARIPVARKVVLCHFVVRAEGLPLALEEAALLLGQPGGPLVISALPARKAKGETDDKLLTVARVVPAAGVDGPALLAEVRAALEPVLPFFDRHILLQQADLTPPLAHPIFQPSEDGEPLGLRPLSDAHDRALFANVAVYPGFGLEGQLLAARACADQAMVLSGRKQVAAV